MADLPHSPKGASSAERWMNCHGSSVLLKKLTLPESDEPEYRGLGIGAHDAAKHCLLNNLDTWEIVGERFHGYEVGEGFEDNGRERIDFNLLQSYLLDVRAFIVPGVTVYIEKRIGEIPEERPHPDFYGTVDFGAYGPEEIVVEDLKWGEGIIVEPEWNAQMMYYAYGLILDRKNRGVKIRSDRTVRLRICQPRAFHHEGPIREWVTTVGEIEHWAETELIPEMHAAEVDGNFDVGDWCRFCPAKLFCPLLTAMFGAAAQADTKALPNFSAQRIAEEYKKRLAVKFYLAALEAEVFRRNSIGHTVPGTKLVYQKSNRVFKEGAESFFKAKYGDKALDPASLKSPAQMEKIGPSAVEDVKEWAYMPQKGLTVAPADDKKPGVKVEVVADTYAHLEEAADPYQP